jgi:hypothetical protein
MPDYKRVKVLVDALHLVMDTLEPESTAWRLAVDILIDSLAKEVSKL